jgi:hypothetical protein
METPCLQSVRLTESRRREKAKAKSRAFNRGGRGERPRSALRKSNHHSVAVAGVECDCGNWARPNMIPVSTSTGRPLRR